MLLSRIILDLVKKHNDEQEKIIKQAFERHFGIPIEKADKSKLDRATVFGSTIEQYRYNKETFLLWDNSLEPEVTNGVNFTNFSITSKYLMV